jgi:hypothetical protein
VLRLLAGALACATLLLAVDPQEHIRKSMPAASANRLDLKADFGTIRVQPGADDSVDVDVSFRGSAPSQRELDRMRRDFTLDVVQNGSDIRVTGAFHDGWKPMLSFFPFFGGHSMCRNWVCLEYGSWLREIEYRVTIPQKFNADVDSSGGPIYVSGLQGGVNAHTSGGSLSFENIDGAINGNTSGGSITLAGGTGRAVVHTSGGPIHIAESAGDVDASTSGGPISIDRSSGRVKAHTSGGRIDIHEAKGPIDASTAGGGVTASLLGQPKEECRFYTSGGSIDVSLGREIHVDLDASTSGGTVWTDFPIASGRDRHDRELRTPLNGGGPRLYLHTSGGAINVRRT